MKVKGARRKPRGSRIVFLIVLSSSMPRKSALRRLQLLLFLARKRLRISPRDPCTSISIMGGIEGAVTVSAIDPIERICGDRVGAIAASRSRHIRVTGWSGARIDGDIIRRSFAGFVRRVVVFGRTACAGASRSLSNPGKSCARPGTQHSGAPAIGVIRLLVDAAKGALTPLFQSAFSPQSTMVEVS